MTFLAKIILAFSMSADAFAAAVSKGASIRRPKITDALRIGLIFGAVETAMPIIGWGMGVIASKFITEIDHWFAFGILTIIGCKMIWEGVVGGHEERKASPKFYMIIFTAIGTSIDAMAVGVTLALINENIWVIAAMIGFATFVMATIGIMAGHYIGAKAGRAAEILGGLCLIAIGTKILIEHLG